MNSKYLVSILVVITLTGFTSMAKAITDVTGENLVANVDLSSADAELWSPPSYTGDIEYYLNLSITMNTGSHLPGMVIFECDLDNNSSCFYPFGYGFLYYGGWDFPPAPRKSCGGLDIGILLVLRDQGDSSQTAFCHGCEEGGTPCGKGRLRGEWYAVALDLGIWDSHSVARGTLIPLPQEGGSGTADCYTFPWKMIVESAYAAFDPGNECRFDLALASDYTNNKWQVSVWHDETFADEDDFGDELTYLNVSDWAPDGNDIKADMGLANLCYSDFDKSGSVLPADLMIFLGEYGRADCPVCTLP